MAPFYWGQLGATGGRETRANTGFALSALSTYSCRKGNFSTTKATVVGVIGIKRVRAVRAVISP